MYGFFLQTTTGSPISASVIWILAEYVFLEIVIFSKPNICTDFFFSYKFHFAVMNIPMTIEEATWEVKKAQDSFLRGELEEWFIVRLRRDFPNAIPDWNRLKLNLLVRIKKFKKRMRDLMGAMARKANTNRRARNKTPGEHLEKKVEKLERQYAKTGCDVILTWSELRRDVTQSFGVSCSM